MVGFNRRFSPLAIHLKEFFYEHAEPLVVHYRINAGFLPAGHWANDPAQGGGRIIGEACHFIDFLTFLVGEVPISVSALGLADSGRYHQDNVILNFSFRDGSIGTVQYLANGDRNFSKERLEVFSAGRVGVIDDFRSLETVSAGHRNVRKSRFRQDKGHQGECRAFVTAILEGSPPPIPYDQITGVARATFAALAALQTGETIRVDPC
jgi:predicted dehydrogenase